MTDIITSTMLMVIAARIEGRFPEEATRLRFIASNVQWMERRVSEQAADELTAIQIKGTA